MNVGGLRREQGLRASDAKRPVDVPCSHPKWQVLNAAAGCVAADHGHYPFEMTDHHSGLRLVDGVPTRYVPA